MVAVLEGEEVTLKIFYKEKGKIKLQPANPDIPPIITDHVEIQGAVIGVIRKYNKPISLSSTKGTETLKCLSLLSFCSEFRIEEMKEDSSD